MNHNNVMDILNRMIIEIDEALIKAKAQIEYIDEPDELMRLGFEEDTISGDLMRDELWAKNTKDRNLIFIMKAPEQTTPKSNTKNIVIGFMVIVIVNNQGSSNTYEQPQ